MVLLPRLKQPQKQQIKERANLRPALVPGPSIPHPLQRKGKHPILFGPQNSTLVQTLLPPLIPDEEEEEYDDDDDPLPSDFPDVPESFLDDVADDDGQDDDEIGTSPRKRARAPRSPEKRHRVARTSQTEMWSRTVVPELVPIFMDLFRKTRSWRDMDALGERGAHQCSCPTDGALLKVAVLTFTSE
jgi:hypothetical protein